MLSFNLSSSMSDSLILFTVLYCHNYLLIDELVPESPMNQNQHLNYLQSSFHLKEHLYKVDFETDYLTFSLIHPP
jgi:hypothetical protein